MSQRDCSCCCVYCSGFVFHKSFFLQSLTPDEGCLATAVVAVVSFVRFGVKKQFDPCYNSLFRVGVIYCALAIHFPWNANRAQAASQLYSSELWLT